MNTIYFIGLFLFMTPVTGDSYVHAVIPPIPAPYVDESGYSVNIEPHVMIFMYPSGTATLLGDWGTKPVATYKTWDYVTLQPHDRISFQATPASGAPVVPPDLAHLQKKCSKFDHLKGGFAAPQFSGASGVVDIRYGALDAVTAFSPNQSNWRMDTRLQYDSAGPLVMTVVNAGMVRALVLPRGSCGVFGYIPASALTSGSHYDHTGSPHELVYLSMAASGSVIGCWQAEHNSQENATARLATGNGSGCPPLYEPWVPRPSTPIARTAAKMSLLGTPGPACPLPFQPMNAPVECPPPAAFGNADCSNTQWP